eukprot:1145011_1
MNKNGSKRNHHYEMMTMNQKKQCKDQHTTRSTKQKEGESATEKLDQNKKIRMKSNNKLYKIIKTKSDQKFVHFMLFECKCNQHYDHKTPSNFYSLSTYHELLLSCSEFRFEMK